MAETTIVIIPGGCLEKQQITLKCKAPDEKINYQFSLANQLQSNEYITSVQAQPAGDSKLTVDSFVINANIFNCLISGGRMNHDIAIRFLILTNKNTVYSFVCKIPIRQQGALVGNGCNIVGVLDDATPAGTVTVGNTTTLPAGSKATVDNVGTGTAAFLNFGIPEGPQGENGETPVIQIGETTILPAGHDATVTSVTKENTVTLNFGIPSGATGEAGQYILGIGTVDTLEASSNATAAIISDGNGGHLLNLSLPQGNKGKDGISPTISIGTVDTLAPDQQATVEIVHGENGKDTLNLGLVKGEKGNVGAVGKDGAPGKDGESYVNNGTTQLNVQNLQLADIKSVNIADVEEGKIMIDSENNQLVRKQNNQWVALNMNTNNFEIETTYRNNTGSFPINFAPIALVVSSDAVSSATGLTAGYVSPDTSKTLPTPTTTLIRVDFKFASTDTTDADYYIVGYEGSLNIRINPNKKTVSVYSAQSKQYEMDYTALGINLHDNKFHTAYFILNAGNQGGTSYAIDGVFFNRGLTQTTLSLSSLRVRGDANNSVAADALTIKNIGISSSLPTLLNNQTVTTDFTSFEGYYSLVNNSLNNQKLSDGILLKPYSVLDSLNSIIPFYLNNSVGVNKALFNGNGMYGGNAVISTTLTLNTFTFECYFKYNSIYDTGVSSRRSILGNINGIFSIGIAANSSSNFTFKNYANNTEETLEADISKDVWHTLAIACKDNVASIFVDGVKKLTASFNFSWSTIFLRGLDWNSYIAPEDALVIKNISMTVGQSKYYQDYDSSLTPDTSNSNGFFYPLIDGVISNQNTKSPVVKIGMNDGDTFSLWTVPNNGTPSYYSNLIPIKYDYDHQPDLQNTKFSRIFLKDIQGNPVKEFV